MRILVEPSDYPALQNLGDLAMQKTALDRIAAFWPNSEILVLSENPDLLPRYANNVRALSAVGRDIWNSGALPTRLLPDSARQWERRLRRRHVRLFSRTISAKLGLVSPQKEAAFRSFMDAVQTADLLVVCGMGGIADVFEEYALDLLDTIDLVKNNGKSTVVMFSQGFGPLGERSPVARRAQDVLPRVDLIALREARASIPLLHHLSVDSSRVMVSGDDALQFAAENRPSAPGDCIGINVRAAFYSNVAPSRLARLRDVIQSFARMRGAPLLPLPSTFRAEEADMEAIAPLIEGYEHARPNAVTTPETLRSELRQCRIAIVGSYHAGVFALAQGVPIVGFYNSDYYRDKFLGLESLFDVAVYPVDLALPDWTSHLLSSANSAWETALSRRAQLVQSVDRQIELGLKAYDRARHLVQERCGQSPSA